MGAIPSDELARRWAVLEEHRQHALRVARARTGNRTDAEDVVSEAMLRAVQLPDLREDTAAGLLATIVIRLSLDLHRRDRTRRTHEATRSGDTRGASVEERVTDEAEARWLSAQLERLATREREVLLHRAAGHTNASTAATLGMSYKSVESAYTRARAHLQLMWRTTLTLVLGVAALGRKALDRVQPTVTTAGVAAAALTMALLVRTGPGTVPAPAIDDARTFDAAIATTQLQPAASTTTRRAGSAATAVARQSARPAAASGPQRSFSTGPVGDPRVVTVTTTYEDDGSLPDAEGVRDCVEGGLYLDLLEGGRTGCKRAYDELHPDETPTDPAVPGIPLPPTPQEHS